MTKKSLSFLDFSLVFGLAQGIGRTLFIFLFLSTENVAQSLFKSGKEYIYSYNATSSTGVLVPSNAASSWNLNGKLVIQAEDDYVTVQVFFLIAVIFYFSSIFISFFFIRIVHDFFIKFCCIIISYNFLSVAIIENEHI